MITAFTRMAVIAVLGVACKSNDGTTTGSAAAGSSTAAAGSSTAAAGSSTAATGGAAPAPGSPAAASGSASGAAARAAGSATATGSAAVTGNAEPGPALDPKIAAARCDEPCLFLVDSPLAKLGETYQAACGKAMPPLPFDDCAKLDQVRKCVYAAHGFVFKQKKWRSYARKPWYTPRPEFKPTQISELERANVAELDAVAKGCKTGLAVSTADLERVKAWIHAVNAKQAPLPRIVHKDGQPATRAELFAYLDEQLIQPPLALDRNTSVSYEPELPSTLLDAIKPPATSVLRSIMIDNGFVNAVDKDNPITEGVQIHMIYDDHDAWLAIDISHYLYD